MSVDIKLIPVEEFQRIRDARLDKYERLSLIADMCRINTLSAVKRAGSGHLGTSFSAMDLVVWLYHEELNTLEVGLDSPERDIYFSSKGHDVPGLYAVLYSLGVIPKEKFLKLRRLGGLDGHPDVGVRGIEANSGSLGMGISKGKGFAWAKRLQGYSGWVYVMAGDGELQEGQNFEAFQSAVQLGINNLTIIVDHNKVQSDKLVNEIVDLGNLVQKIKLFGWNVIRCDGHDFQQIETALEELKSVSNRPSALVADTLKGRGVSFMEHPYALRFGQGLYPWHAGAPDDNSYEMAHHEIITRTNESLISNGLRKLTLEIIEPEERLGSKKFSVSLAGEPVSQALQERIVGGVSDEYVAKAFGDALVEIGKHRKDLVVLDGDLAADCRIRDFETTFPDRFIEIGIAEQDMVSTAGGLARLGLLPVVNSFASFLASRANEQIYTNAGEKTKIIYALHYSGLIPAGPGKSHQSIRDISLLSALPNMIILQPCNALETKMVLDFCVSVARENCAIRLVIGPSPRRIELPDDYKLQFGYGIPLTGGNDAIIFAYGPVMLHEALLCGEILAERDFGLKVVNMPWLNRVDLEWLANIIRPHKYLYVLEDHAPVGGLGDHLLDILVKERLIYGHWLKKFAVEGYPACGTPPQALQFHGLDALSLAKSILEYQDQPVMDDLVLS